MMAALPLPWTLMSVNCESAAARAVNNGTASPTPKSCFSLISISPHGSASLPDVPRLEGSAMISYEPYNRSWNLPTAQFDCEKRSYCIRETWPESAQTRIYCNGL